MFTALIPVKEFRFAKQRLAKLLTPEERYELALSMFLDAMGLVSQVPTVNDIVVVTADELAQKLARRHGARIIEEIVPAELNAALDRSAAALAREGISHLMILPTDVVRAMPVHLTELSESHLTHETGLTIAAARFDLGTNGLLVTPPDAIPFRFGMFSCIRHYKIGRTRGYSVRVRWVPGLDRDIDYPRDLQALWRELRVRQCGRKLHTVKSIQRMSGARVSAIGIFDD